MAVLHTGTFVPSQAQVHALETAAKALPERWRVVTIGDLLPTGGFELTIEGPGVFAAKTIPDGSVGSALLFLDDVRRRRR